MPGVAVGLDGPVARWIVVAFVQAQVLRGAQVLRDLVGRLPALDHNGLKGRFQQFRVVAVGRSEDCGERATLLLGQNRAFYAVFRAVGGIGA